MILAIKYNSNVLENNFILTIIDPKKKIQLNSLEWEKQKHDRDKWVFNRMRVNACMELKRKENIQTHEISLNGEKGKKLG